MAGYKKNLRLAKEHLNKGETVQTFVFGTYEGKMMGEIVPRNGVFGATEKRIVFFGNKMFGYDLESFEILYIFNRFAEKLPTNPHHNDGYDLKKFNKKP